MVVKLDSEPELVTYKTSKRMLQSLYAAMITSACFTLERALAVCDPLKSMRLCTRNKSIKICLASWLASFVYNVCVGIMKLAVYSHLPGQLVIFNDSLFLVDLTLFYFAPFVLSTICYWKILRALRARAKLFLQGAVNGFNPNTAQGNRQNNSGNHTGIELFSEQGRVFPQILLELI
ncbi:thyrotropin-releasing hormone receptor-like [Convolutriloba macropyga]|uniref:thyrotropin-releasing hormone receptor-like n=1 Tax=Convolutriloba macropyga TaxID=536237 RepID=UPI003F5229EE